jgi:hypothetical protein
VTRDDAARHGLVEATMEAFLDRTRTVAELMAAAGRGALGVLPEPVPGAVTGMLSAMRQLSEQMPPVTAELDVLVEEVHAKRLSIQALQAELRALDSQLAVLERTLAPVQDWTRRWERLRGSLASTLAPHPTTPTTPTTPPPPDE